jgi:hypothetical protein
MSCWGRGLLTPYACADKGGSEEPRALLSLTDADASVRRAVQRVEQRTHDEHAAWSLDEHTARTMCIMAYFGQTIDAGSTRHLGRISL